MIDRANRQDVLRFKEALHIQTSNGHFNRDVGTDIPQCWPALFNPELLNFTSPSN